MNDILQNLTDTVHLPVWAVLLALLVFWWLIRCGNFWRGRVDGLKAEIEIHKGSADGWRKVAIELRDRLEDYLVDPPGCNENEVTSQTKTP